MAVALLASAVVSAQSLVRYEVRIEAPADIEPVLRQHLDIVRWSTRAEVTEAQLRQLFRTAPAQVRTLLATEGYFAPAVGGSLEGAGKDWIVYLDVKPGESVRVSGVTLQLAGPITTDPEFETRLREARDALRTAEGRTFRQSDWDASKDGVLAAVRRSRYAAARITASEARIDPRRREARLAITVDSGPAFRFGDVIIDGLSRYPDRVVENLAPFGPGTAYDESLLLRYQRRLLASGYFASAIVSADSDPAQAAATPVRVKIVEGAARKVELGLGFSTDRGPRAQARYTDRNTLDRALRFSGSVKVDRLSQEAIGGLAWPTNATGHAYGLEGRYNFQDIQGEQLTNWSVTGARAFTVEVRESAQSLQFLTESRALADGSGDDRKALFLAQTWRWNNLDDLLAPRRGYFLSLQVGGAQQGVLTDRSFGRVHTRANYLLPIGTFGTVVLRGELGTVLANRKDGIPSAYLYRAGGDTSVRGYAFQSLGVIEGGSVVGGRYLGVTSAEYIQWFKPEWGAAVFADAGNAADRIKDFEAAVGYGVGLRWSSPIGSLNLDVARARDLDQWRLHFSAGLLLQ